MLDDARRQRDRAQAPARLRPGRYVLALVATDAAGNRAAPVTVRFRVLEPGR